MTLEVGVAIGLGVITALQTAAMAIAGNARKDRIARDTVVNVKLDKISEDVGEIRVKQATYIERTDGHSGQLRTLWDIVNRRRDPRWRPDPEDEDPQS